MAPKAPKRKTQQTKGRSVKKVKIEEVKSRPGNWTATYTFSECVENHRGMQMLGNIASHGWTLEELKEAKAAAQAKGMTVEWVDLQQAQGLADNRKTPENAAIVLIVRGFAAALSQPLTDEVHALETSNQLDRHAFMYGRVTEKPARFNLTVADMTQEVRSSQVPPLRPNFVRVIQPLYAEKKGRVLDFKELPQLAAVRAQLPQLLGARARNLLAELNYYYDISACGIGYHGDKERRLVVGLRLGASMNLHFCWFHQEKPISEPVVLTLHGGDLYVMSNKASGSDWRSPSLVTLRHAAGANKFTKLA